MIRKTLALLAVCAFCCIGLGCEGGGGGETVNPQTNEDGTPKAPRKAPGPGAPQTSDDEGGG